MLRQAAPLQVTQLAGLRFRHWLWMGILTLLILMAAIAGISMHRLAELRAIVALNADASSSVQQATATIYWIAGLAVAALVTGAATALLLERWLKRTLGADPLAVRERVREIGANNLRSVRHTAPPDSITTALTGMTRALADTVNQVRRASHEVESGSDIVTNTCAELATRVEQQASMLSETASAMEQLGVTVEHNASRAGEVDSEARDVARLANECDTGVAQVESTMQELSARSEEVATIVSTIDNIAFQTNLLALNASVEAARAGEHGRGFAVVAQEVRQLATRSADASRQISQLIHANLELVAQSAGLADQAGKKTRQSKQAIERVTGLVGEISQAIAEQTRAVQEVSKAISEMDSVTQQNARLVRRNAEAGDALRARSNQLGDAIATFDLDDEILLPRARTTQEARSGQLPTGARELPALAELA